MEVIGFLGMALLAGLGYWGWRWRRQQAERAQAAEGRLAAFMAEAMAAARPAGAEVTPAPKPADPAQRLLFEAATKAGEANEPVLAIQLYARLIARFPEGACVGQARAAVEALKKRLAKV